MSLSPLEQFLQSQLSAQGFDLVDLIPIPTRADRMVRLRTLEEALNDFDQDPATDSVGYLVQLKPRKAKASVSQRSESGTAAAAPSASAGIYLPDGKLNVPFLTENAQLLFSAKEYALARNVYRTLLQSGECSASALFWIGRCNEAEGRLAEARTSYEESITYLPSLEVYQRLAAVLIRMKKDESAADVMERALNLRELGDQTRFELHRACAGSWMRAENAPRAEKHFQKALQIQPDSDSIECNLGALYLRIGKTVEARVHFQNAERINPKNDRAIAGIASCHLAEGDKRAAHDAFARALEINLNNATAMYHLVKCAYEIRSHAIAARLLEDYVQVAPVNTSLLYSLAGLQYHLGRFADARATADRILELQPGHTGAKDLLSKML